MTQDEIWKPIIIEGEELPYKISNKGNIRHTKRDRKLKTSNHSGYARVGLCNKKFYLIHRLVMLTFNPTDNPEKYDVHHKDGIKTNNRLENLEWMDKREHILMEIRKGTIKIAKKGKEALTFKGHIGQFTKEGTLKNILTGLEDIDKVTKYCTDVYHVVSNKYGSFHGYVYRRFPMDVKPEIGKKYDLYDDMFTQFFKHRLSKIPKKSTIQLQLPI